MWEYLDKLKRKPKAVRQQIAFSVSMAISILIFSLWWTTFTASESESTVSVGEALSPVSALAGMAVTGVDSFGKFTENLKSHVLQVQYSASNTDPSLHREATAESDNASTGGVSDVVYPEEVFEDRRPAEMASTTTSDQ